MAEAANDTGLKNGFQQHLRETQNQVTRLERIFKLMGKSAQGKPAKP